jgi:predicted small lipoprotein YifL
MTRPFRIVTVSLALAVAIAGCGVKGSPLPPEAVRPERITDLSATADKDGIRLSWGRPERSVSGRTIRDLTGFMVMRAQDDEPWRQVGEVKVTDRERFQKVHRFEYLDAATELGGTYRYEVVSSTENGERSDASNLIEFRRVNPPPPPNPEKFALPTPTPLH